jgi:3-carboxy-cis,cis-muconate cycloisomerase
MSVSRLFRGRYSTPEVAKIWSDRARQQYCLDFEAKLALVQGRLGIIPQEASEVIQAKCDVGLMDIQGLEDETTLTGNSVLPLVKELVRLGNEVQPGLGEWAHWGATTQVYIPRKLDDFKTNSHYLFRM